MSELISDVRRSDHSGICQLRSECGVAIDLHIDRYLGQPSRAERRFLRSVAGPVVDIGCGPGRAAAYLREQGTVALGLDASARLADLARANGALCVNQNVFDPVPFEGRWHSVLLLDGNIGIGGDPRKMLGRLSEIVESGGRAYVEVDAVGPTQQLIVREHRHGSVGAPFAWAVLSMTGIDDLIADSEWRCHAVHTIRDRPAGERWPGTSRNDRLVVELERTA